MWHTKDDREGSVAGDTLELKTISRRPSLFETASDELLRAIRQSNLAPGSRIPSERELGEQFGVSRTVIREAIRHLAAKGVLEVQSGSGVIVADIGHEGVSESIDLYLRQRGPVEPNQISEVRETLELKVVALAAERATDEQLVRIREICELMKDVVDDVDASSQADVDFHRAIAEATGNPLFVVLVDTIGDVLYQIRRVTLTDSDRVNVGYHAHQEIISALEARDVDGAVEAMRSHLRDSLAAIYRARATS